MDPPSAALLPSRISNLSLDQPLHAPSQPARIQSKFDPKAASAQALAAGLPPKPLSSHSRPSPSRPPHPSGGGNSQGGSALLKMAMGGAAASAGERYSHYGAGGPPPGGHHNNALPAGPSSSSQHGHPNPQQQHHPRPQSSSFHNNAPNPNHVHTAQGLHGPAHATHLRVAASSLGGAQARQAGAAAYDKVVFGKYDGGFEADERERNGGREGTGEEGGVMLGKVKELELNSGGPEEGGMTGRSVHLLLVLHHHEGRSG